MNHKLGRRGFLKMAATVLAALGMSKTQAATAAPKARAIEEAGIPIEGVQDAVGIVQHSHPYDGGSVTLYGRPSPDTIIGVSLGGDLVRIGDLDSPFMPGKDVYARGYLGDYAERWDKAWAMPRKPVTAERIDALCEAIARADGGGC